MNLVAEAEAAAAEELVEEAASPRRRVRRPSSQLSVAEVRRALALLRRGWEEVSTDPRSKPMYLSDSLGMPSVPSLSVDAFALQFVLAHHAKRIVRSDALDGGLQERR
jgi:hypothetical protein